MIYVYFHMSIKSLTGSFLFTLQLLILGMLSAALRRTSSLRGGRNPDMVIGERGVGGVVTRGGDK